LIPTRLNGELCLKSLRVDLTPETLKFSLQLMQMLDKPETSDVNLDELYSILRGTFSSPIDVLTALRACIRQTGTFGSCLFTQLLSTLKSKTDRLGPLDKPVILVIVQEVAEQLAQRIRDGKAVWAERELAKCFLEAVRRTAERGFVDGETQTFVESKVEPLIWKAGEQK
jgi:hypothetical protein